MENRLDMSTGIPLRIESMNSVYLEGSATSGCNMNYHALVLDMSAPMGMNLHQQVISDPVTRSLYEAEKCKYELNIDNMHAEGRLNSVKYYRIKRGLTQKKLAEYLGVPQSEISRWEQDNPLHITLTTWSRLAEFFDVTMEEIHVFRG